MTGTFINVITVVTGALLGTLLGSRLHHNLRVTVMNGLGLVTSIIGIKMALGTSNVIIILGSILVGGIIGRTLDLMA